MAYRNYGPNAGYVVAKDGTGDFLTIAAALTVAGSLGGSGTIYIKVGTYTENPALVAGWNLVAWDADADTPNVIINGKCTFSSAGSVSISGIEFQTNSDYCLSVTGNSASIVYLNNCYINCLNNIAINFSSSSASSHIYIDNCIGNTGTTGINFFTNSSSGFLSFNWCILYNSASSLTAANTSSGTTEFIWTRIDTPLTASSTGSIVMNHGQSRSGFYNTTSVTLSGTSTLSASFFLLGGGTASALVIGAGCAATLNDMVISSGNTNAITGAGTLTYGSCTFTGSSSTINVTTQNPIAWPVKQGGTLASSFTAYSVICAGTTTTGAFQNVSGVGTTGQVLTSAGASALPSWSSTPAGVIYNVTRQVFTSSGTYTPTSGMLFCDIEVVGGGGGSGGCGATNAAQVTGSSGGGGGGYARGIFSASTIGVSQTVTVGAAGTAGAASNSGGGTGGTTSVGSLISATGGGGGSGFFVAGTVLNTGGAGGVGSNGDFQTHGTPGRAGIGYFTASFAIGGGGGSSFFGGGAIEALGTSGTVAATAATSFGGGGGGGCLLASQASSIVGAAGAKGVVIITEYI